MTITLDFDAPDLPSALELTSIIRLDTQAAVDLPDPADFTDEGSGTWSIEFDEPEEGLAYSWAATATWDDDSTSPLSGTVGNSEGGGFPTAEEIAIAVRDVDNATPADGSLGQAINESAEGGGGTLTITPLLAAVTNPRSATRDLPPIAQHSQPSDVWTITDATGTAINLSGKTIRFVALQVDEANEDDDATDDELTGLYTYETSGSGIVISGASSNIVTVTHSSANTETAGNFRYELWNVTDRLLLASGKLPIKAAVFEV